MDYLKAYTTESVFTTNEVAEMIGISKQMIAMLVKQGKLSYMRQTPNGLLFHSSDIEAYKNRNADHPHVDILKHLSGYTTQALKFFHENRAELGAISKISIYFDDMDAILDGYFDPSTEDYGLNMHRVISPSMVLTDTKGKEMWLAGCNCGYGGTGPQGSAEILRTLAVDLDIETILGNKVIKIFNQKSGWSYLSRDSVYDEIRSPENNSKPQLQFYLKDGKLVLLQDEDPHWDISLADLIARYRAFLPNPVFITIFHSNEQARAQGFFRRSFQHGRDIAYRIILKDEKGNQIWLRYNESSERHLLDDSKIQDILEYCNFSTASVSKIDALKNWINLKVLNQEPAPIVLYGVENSAN